MKAVVNAKDVARYIGYRHKTSIKLADFFGKKTAEAKGKPSLENHYLNVWLGHAHDAALWQQVAKDFQAGLPVID